MFSDAWDSYHVDMSAFCSIMFVAMHHHIALRWTSNSMQKSKGGEATEHLIATLKSEKEELELSLSKEKLQSLQLKQDLAEAETRNTDLYKVITLYGIC